MYIDNVPSAKRAMRDHRPYQLMGTIELLSLAHLFASSRKWQATLCSHRIGRHRRADRFPWSRNLFESMYKGGLTTVQLHVRNMEGFEPSMRAIAQWKQWLREHPDIPDASICSRRHPQSQAGREEGRHHSRLAEFSRFQVRIWADTAVPGARAADRSVSYHTANMAGTGPPGELRRPRPHRFRA